MGKEIQRFVCKVDHFSTRELSASRTFWTAGNLRWRILVYPKGEEEDGYLSVYLGLIDGETIRHVLVDPETMRRRGWSVTVDFTLAVVNQTDPDSSVKKGSKMKFLEGEDECGWKRFLRLSDLHDPRQGFLLDDTLVIEAQVSIPIMQKRRAATAKAGIGKSDGMEANEPVEEDTDTDMAERPKTSASPSPDEQNRRAAAAMASSDKSNAMEADEPDEEDDHMIRRPKTTSPSPEEQADHNSADDDATSPPPLSPSPVNLTSTDNNEIQLPQDDDSLQRLREQLVKFFTTPLEAIAQSQSFDDVHKIALNVAAHAATGARERRIVLDDVASRVAEFKDVVPRYMSTIEASHVVASQAGDVARDVEARLDFWTGQLSRLEDGVSRLEQEEVDELHSGRRARIIALRSSKVAEMKKAGREAAKAMDELEKRRGEREEAGERRRRAEEKLAQCNASWKLFKGKLGW